MLNERRMKELLKGGSSSFSSLVKEKEFEKEEEKKNEKGEKRKNKIFYSKNRGERKKAYQSYFCSTFDKPFHSYSKEKKFLDGVFFVVNILLSCDCFCVDFLIYTMTKPILRGVLWRFI